MTTNKIPSMLDRLAHHAYAVAGEASGLVLQIVSELEETLNCRARGNPDFHVETHDVMGVAESRALIEAAGRVPVGGGKKIFVISARGITMEAQNALLKLFEEPTVGTHFFLVVPSLEIVLPTLRSRLFLLRADSAARKSSQRAKEFLHDAIPARLKLAQRMIKDTEENGEKRDLILFLTELEHELAEGRELAAELHKDGGRVRGLQEILAVKRYAHDRAPSFKLLLEHLALVLPRI